MNWLKFIPYLLVMALVTYFIRMIPLVLIKKKITNPFLLSFLHYVPYAVLSAMTFPAILYATSSMISAICGFICALILSIMNKSLIKVASGSCLVVLLVELILEFI